MSKEKDKWYVKWFVDSVLTFLYSVFMVGGFLILIGYREQVTFLVALSGLSLTSFCISYVLVNLERTMKIIFSSSLLGFGLTLVAIAPNYFDYYRWAESVVACIGFIILVLVLSILSTIAGGYVAEITRKGERRLTLRCSNCGTWNEQDAIHCSYCGKNLHAEHYTDKKRNTGFHSLSHICC